jgi:hypothetical protein
MLDAATLRSISAARIQDADVLFANSRWDGAGYICGYAVELTLKARIVDTLKWAGFPQTKKEFENLSSFKTHNLDVLLALSGKEQDLKQALFADWSIVAVWNPEARYQAVGSLTAQDVQAFLESAKRIIAAL